MSLFRNIGDFIESKESWTQYSERLNQFFCANDIVKKAAMFLSTIGLTAYHTWVNLLAPGKPFDKSYDDLVTVMKSFYSPKPSVIIQHYRFDSPPQSPITHSSNTSSIKNLEDSKEDSEYNLFVLSSSSTSPLYSTISVNGCPINMEVDTRAAFSIISQETYKQLFPSGVLQKVTFVLKLKLTLENPSQFMDLSFEINYETQNMSTLLVTCEKGRSLMGHHCLSSLQLDWKSIINLQDTLLQNVVQQYCSVFQG